MASVGVSVLTDNFPALPGLDAGQNRLPAGAPNGIPQFFNKAVRKADGSFANVEFVAILIPGDGRAVAHRKVTDGLRRKYAPYYEAWRKGLETSPVGTPLEAWPVMTPAFVHTLKAQNIFTVEQLSEVSDSALYSIPMGTSLRNKARDWLKIKQDSDAVEQFSRREETLVAANNMLQKQLEDLAARLSTVEAGRAEPKVAALPPDDETPARRGPGRPPNPKE